MARRRAADVSLSPSAQTKPWRTQPHWSSHAATAGIAFRAAGCRSPFIAPQSVWPQTTMSRTPSPFTAYSIAEVTAPAASLPYRGTMLPALRATKISPGSHCSRISGMTRESEQEMTSVCGVWPSRTSCS